jgi:hypothetical protein
VHLCGGCRHAEKCTQDKCVRGCGFREFDQWLDSPVLKSDVRADQRRRERLTLLTSGGISA